MSRINQTLAIKTKVIVGFGLVLMALFAASYFSYESFNKLMSAVNVIAQPNEKLLQIDSILVTITKTENTLQEYTVSKSDEKLTRYYNQIESMRNQINALKSDNEFKEDEELDSVVTLLDARLVNFKEFMEIKEKKNDFDFYDKTLNELEDQIKTKKTKADTIDSVNVDDGQEEEKQGWIKWLVRNKNKRDPISEEIQESLPDNADSVMNLNADSVKQILIKVRSRQAALQRSLTEQELNYLSNNSDVMDKIYQLVRQIKQEKQLNSEDRTQNAKANLENSIFRIGIIMVLVFLVTIIIVYLIFADITRSDYYRKKLQVAKSEAERLARVKEDFLANMSHEIRTPLTAILGFTKQLKQTPLDEEQSEYIEAVDKSSEHLLGLVNDILDFSKIEAGELKFEHTPFDIVKVVEQVKIDLVPQASKKNLKLTYSSSNDELRYLSGDAFRLKQVLYNLIYNAIKFTEKGSIDVHCSLESVTKNLTKACISVHDTGIGIPVQKLKEIFSAFSQTDVSNTRKYGGTGLGLTISKRLIEAQGGRIDVNSVEGQGSKFDVILTFEKSTQNAVEKEVQEVAIQNDCFVGNRVLVVDDDALNVKLVSLILEKWGINAVLCSSGKEGLEAYKHEDFDLVLCDLQMPEMDGRAVVKKVREYEKAVGKSTPFVAFTARILKDEWDMYEQIGMDDYLLKPFSEEEMFQLFYKYFKDIPALKPVEGKADPSVSKLNNEIAHESANFAHISLKNIKMFTGNDDEALIAYLESFTKVNEENIGCMKQALETHNVNDISFYSHKMFSGVQQLELKDLAANLRKLELLSTVNATWDAQVEELVGQVIREGEIMLVEVKQQLEVLQQKPVNK